MDLYVIDKENIQIEEKLKQNFHHTPSHKVDINALIRKRIENENELSDRDLEIAKFLLEVKFATLEQITRYLKLRYKDEDIQKENIKRKVEKLVTNKVINKFNLAMFKYQIGEMPPKDSLWFYCLDYGGAILIEHFLNEEDNIIDWQVRDVCDTSESISKYYDTVEFVLKVMEELNENLLGFSIKPCYDLDFLAIKIKPSLHMCISTKNGEKHFIVEVVKNFDLPNKFAKKIEKYEKFLSTEAWSKKIPSSDAPPILLLIFDDDTTLNISCGLIEKTTTKIETYRMTTKERLKNPLYQAGTFIKFNKEKEVLQSVSIPLFKK